MHIFPLVWLSRTLANLHINYRQKENPALNHDPSVISTLSLPHSTEKWFLSSFDSDSAFFCVRNYLVQKTLEVIRTTISMLTISPGFLLRLTVKFYPVFILVVVVIHAIHDM